MPSLADIPQHLIMQGRKHDFLYWLRELPADIYVCRHLMRLWSSSTNTTFQSDDWNYIERIKRR